MDLTLQNAWNKFRLTNSSEDGFALAELLLRINDLDYYEANMGNDPKLIAVIKYLRIRAIPEASKVIDQLNIILPLYRVSEATVYDTPSIFPELLTPNQWIFRDSDGDPLFKFTNVYCRNIPIATLRIKNYQELRETLTWCKKYFSVRNLLPPPKQITLNTLGNQKYLFLANYKEKTCDSFEYIVENSPAFDLNSENASPIYRYQQGKTLGNQRPVTEEDYVEDERGFRYKMFEYDMLPKFAKPKKIAGSPHSIIAGTTTRQQIGGFSSYGDEGVWSNVTYPIAKIYIGYLINYLQQWDAYHWRWANPTYLYQCGECGNSIETDDYHRNSDRCNNYFDTENGGRRYCNNYWERTVSEPTRLEVDPNYPDTPEPPEYINEALAFLERFYDYEDYGDIYSTRSGQELSLSLQEEKYGPNEDA